MKAPTAALLALLLLLAREPGRGQAQLEEEEEEENPGLEGYEDEDYDEEETNLAPGGTGGRAQLQCYSCETLHPGESCDQLQRCFPSQTFCKTMVSHSETGYLTTFSAWCTDTCDSFTKTVEGTQLAVSCCQSSLCNQPPWQSPKGQAPPGSVARGPQGPARGGLPGSRAAGSRGSPPAVGAALLLTLLAPWPALEL
ncbi:glycosylphosphatidylinositol-anchored high density lipoprotein-binding protein 1 [Tenrec ecaudatus]|uniref:glycosylphosphatidylinositol-anchored high density lipoprotein-binding protein 1 n=1 Tax=Tenrec ecaudatus TaxID=94439 RepID=UPI003F5AA1C6